MERRSLPFMQRSNALTRVQRHRRPRARRQSSVRKRMSGNENCTSNVSANLAEHSPCVSNQSVARGVGVRNKKDLGSFRRPPSPRSKTWELFRADYLCGLLRISAEKDFQSHDACPTLSFSINPPILHAVLKLSTSLRAQRSNPRFRVRHYGLLCRFAPLRKRFAFVVGNDGSRERWLTPASSPAADAAFRNPARPNPGRSRRCRGGWRGCG
jgi:hypothetical protein